MIEDVIAKADLHIRRATAVRDEIASWEDFDVSVYTQQDNIKTIDAFIFRYIKLQDIVGGKLFRAYLNATGDYRDDMTMIDILDKLEKIGILESADRWMRYRELRNLLTHEYPDNEAEMVNGIKDALIAFDETIAVVERIRERSPHPDRNQNL